MLCAPTGMPNSGGLKSRSRVLANVDAPPVALLKRAGAIPLGVTNTSELCMWMESNNHLYGITSNPYDLERMCGGSSGLAKKKRNIFYKSYINIQLIKTIQKLYFIGHDFNVMFFALMFSLT